MHIEKNNNQLRVCLTLAEVVELADPQLLNKLSVDGYYDLLDNIFTDEQTDVPYDSLQGLYESNENRISCNKILDDIFNETLKIL